MNVTRTLPIVSVLAALIVGAVSGGLFMQYREQKRAVFFMQANLYSDLHASQLAAFRAYMEAPPKVAIWAQEDFLRRYRIYRMKLKGTPAEKLDASDSYRDFAHARLAKLYDQMGNKEASNKHLEEALSGLNQKDRESLFQMLESTDPVVKKHYQQEGMWR